MLGRKGEIARGEQFDFVTVIARQRTRAIDGEFLEIEIRVRPRIELVIVLLEKTAPVAAQVRECVARLREPRVGERLRERENARVVIALGLRKIGGDAAPGVAEEKR